MATKLEKNVSRETTIEVDGKPVMVTLTAEQSIELKLKGKRTSVEIDIEELYEQLNGGSKKPSKSPKESKGNPVISLHDLRHHSAISGLEPEDLAKFDGIIRNLIKEWYS